MYLQRSCRGILLRPSSRRLLRTAGRGGQSVPLVAAATARAVLGRQPPTETPVGRLSRWPGHVRNFHASSRLQVIKPVVLADIGEGIVECEIIQWFVQPGARVEEFSPLCEVQSDKASVEITSRFAGVVRKLHYEAGEMAKVGQPFVDIDIPDEVGATDTASAPEPTPVPSTLGADETSAGQRSDVVAPTHQPMDAHGGSAGVAATEAPTRAAAGSDETAVIKKKFAGSSLATPAVRHLSKELNLDITQIDGTGKDGRVTKDDLHRFAQEQKEKTHAAAAAPSAAAASSASPAPSSLSFFGAAPRPAIAATVDAEDAAQQETPVPLGGTQLQMFKAMTRSLTIPHFLYADEIDFTQLHGLRKRLNAVLTRSASASASAVSADGNTAAVTKLSYLPFVIKALSMALHHYPVINARVDVPDPAANSNNSNNNNNNKPRLIYRSQHNIGVAMDTPSGLVVPVIRNVNARSVLSIAGELARLQGRAKAGKLTPADLQGGTITVSNIGNIGGTYLSPVMVEREVAILGIGRVRTVPAFADDGDADAGTTDTDGPLRVVKRHVCHFSFSADHRVVDGATAARALEIVRQLVEKPDVMAVQLR
ncbi:biotin-dependent 2-oxo acid dehydrogenase [Niveomyces insectorum RCEF 264]|uniref:Dihydrolipoamide acetyltransferase component of pyruvate dehydrogenase complex n=1 Tax=Niveomyces insectorum RCEF 264 TaxID=1081102 RepID=A0A162JBY8_9HYPO|nr:biotin-dependent 2-oxo acid dehydrogenase [Niveomyces insectorum RCEF 264]